MNEVIKKLRFQVKANSDEVAKLRAELEKLKEAAGATRPPLDGLVPPAVGRRVDSLNSSTAKASQLMMLMGNATSGAAGSAVRYGGTLVSLIGHFNVWNLVAIGVTAAVAGLAHALFSKSEEQKRLESIIAEQTKLERNLNDEYERQILLLQGLSAQQIDAKKAQENLSDLSEYISRKGFEVIRLQKELASLGFGAPLSDRAKAQKAYDTAVNDLDVALARMANTQKKADIERLKLDVEYQKDWEDATKRTDRHMQGQRDEAARKTLQAAREHDREMKQRYARFIDDWANDEARAMAGSSAREKEWSEAKENAINAGVDAALAARRRELALEEAIEEASYDNQEYWAQERKRLQEKAFEDQMIIMQASISATTKVGEIVGEVAGAIGASQEQQMRIGAFFQAITDALNAAHCFATAAEYFAAPFGAGTAQGVAYSIAGAMYAASATLAAAKAGGAFSGGGGSGGGAASGGGGGGGGSGVDYGRAAERGGGGAVTINVNAPVDSRETAEWLAAKVAEAWRRRNPNAPYSEVG